MASSMSASSNPIPFKLIESINGTPWINPKAALQLCDKCIKKRPDSPHLRSIRAYLLAQNHRESEAEALARDLLADEQNARDELIKSTLSRTFSLIGDWERAGQLLGDMFRARPTAETGLNLFDTLLRSAELKRAFAVALKLAGLTDEPAFLVWALTICLADRQFRISREPGWASDDLLERMADKVRKGTIARGSHLAKGLDDTGSLADEKRLGLEVQQIEELRLLTDVFLLLPSRAETSARETIMELLNSLEAKGASASDIVQVLHCLMSAGLPNECWSVSSRLLRENGLHDWSLWLRAFESCSKVHTDFRVVLGELLDEIAAKSDQRTVLIARLHSAAQGVDATNSRALLAQYVEKYPEGQFIAHDVRFLFRDAPQELCSELFQFCSEKSRSSNSCAVWRVLTGVFDRHKARQLVKPTTSDEADKGHVNLHDAITLASTADCQSLLQASRLLSGDGSLPSDATPYSYVVVQLVLSLLNGDFSSALGLFKLLDIKMIQMDTLLYLVSDHVFVFGAFEIAEGIFEENFQIYGLAQKEMSDGLFKALQRAQYSLSVEFLRFMKRMDSSLQSLACVSGSIWSRLMRRPLEELASALEPLIGDEEILLDEKSIAQCSDNRDRSIFMDIDPTGSLSNLYDEHLPTFKIADYYFRILFSLVIRALLRGGNGDDVRQSVARYCDQLLGCEPFSSVASPLEQSLIEYARLAYLPLLSDEVQDSDMSRYGECLSICIKCIDDRLKEPDGSPTLYDRVARCSEILQTLRLLCLLVGGPICSLAGKIPKASARRRFQHDLVKTGDCCRRVRRYFLEGVVPAEKGNTDLDRFHKWISQMAEAVDRNCVPLLA